MDVCLERSTDACAVACHPCNLGYPDCSPGGKRFTSGSIDAVLATLGGQTALNAAVALHEQGILEKYDVELIDRQRSSRAPLIRPVQAPNLGGYVDVPT